MFHVLSRLFSICILTLAACSSGGGGGGGSGVGTNRGPTLSTLSLSGTTLSPAFDRDVFVYSAAVPSPTSSVTLTASAEDAGRVNGRVAVNGQDLGPGTVVQVLPLAVGPNVITVTVTRNDGSASTTYTVTVTRAPVPELDALSLAGGALMPVFAPSTMSYSLGVGYLTLATNVTASTSVAGATIEIDGTVVPSGQPSDAIPLAVGNNDVVVRLSTLEGESRDYTISVVRESANEFAQEAFLTGIGGAGRSVSLSGDTLAVGAPEYDSAPISQGGAVYVFRRAGMFWVEEALVTAPDAGDNDDFGWSVSLDGDTLAIGAYREDQSFNFQDRGAAYVFVRNGAFWQLQAKLLAPFPNASDNFGRSVALDGDTLAVGAPRENSSTTGINGPVNQNASNSGAAYVFRRSGTSWSIEAFVKASNTAAGDGFGFSVALDGDTLAVGAPDEEDAPGTSSTGAAYLFVRDGTTWSQQALLRASNAVTGDQFGGAVALRGDTVAIGATGRDTPSGSINENSGAVHVYARSGTNWIPEAVLRASSPTAGALFGGAVAARDDVLAIGAIGENSTGGSGAAYLFLRDGTTWNQTAFLKAANPASGFFGISVSLDGDSLAVGAITGANGATVLR